MAKLKQTENKLLRAGYARDPNSSNFHHVWVDATPAQGANITFWVRNGTVDGSFKVDGAEPDRPEFDAFHSTYVTSLAAAIEISRLPRKS